MKPMAFLGRLLLAFAILVQPVGASATVKPHLRLGGALPSAVTALGLGPVYALKASGAGLTGAALTNTPTSHAQTCTTCTVSGNDFYIQASNTLTNWDFTGYEVHFEGDQTTSCGNCLFTARNDRGAAVDISQAGDTATNVTFNDSKFDDRVYYAPGGEAPIKINGHGNVTFNRDYHTASTRGQIAMGGTGLLTVSYNYFGGVGIGTGGIGWGGFHAETIHQLAGTLVFDHSYIDYRSMAGAVTSGVTGFLTFQTFNPGGSVTATVTSSIFQGAAYPSTIPNCHALDVAFTSDPTAQCADFTGGLSYGMQSENGVGAVSKGPVDITLTGNALGRGSSGYLATTIDSGSTITTHPSGNYNFDTGASLGSTLP
jgi:hypothetical protein